MRKLAMFAAAAAFVGMGGVASAAGLHEHESYKDQPVYAPSFTWTGFYLGGHGGGGWGTSDWVFGEQNPAHNSSPDIDGGFGGIQSGYNIQINKLVLGLEGTLSWASIEGGAEQPGYLGTFNQTELTWIGDISLRAGIALDRTLIYAKTGVAWGGFEHDVVNTNNNVTYHAATDNQVGWLIGGGVEFALNNNWSIKGEYNYATFGSGSYYVPNWGSVGADQDVSTIKGGVNYRFGLGLTPLK